MEIYGTYKETKFRNESNGYTIFKLELNDFIPEFERKYVFCSGILSQSFVCLPLKLTGEKVIKDFCETFAATNIEPYIENRKCAVNFLGSCCKGISEKTANEIVGTVGEDVFALSDNPDAYSILTSIDGIGPQKAKVIINAVGQAKRQKETLAYIEPFGGNFMHAEKMLQKYGADALTYLKQNPYKVGLNCGFEFLACDLIAKDNGFEAISQERIETLILQVIEADYNNGNSYITLNRLLANVNYIAAKKSAFLGQEISPYQLICICEEIKNIVTEIKENEIRYYFRRSYENEMKVAQNIKRLQKGKRRTKINVRKTVSECEAELDIKYSEKQKECFNFLSSTGIKVITGGPGTGKSTVINGLIHAYQKLHPKSKIVMMAPTGRAAQRLNEITGHEAGTIHRMLGIMPYGDRIQTDYNGDYPADMIIVDESSMVDNELMMALTESIRGDSLLIMVGDIDQLPSVGAGSVLRDIINAGIETVMLDVNYRQKGKSIIIDNAITINSGSNALKRDESFCINVYKEPTALVDAAVDKFLSAYDKTNPFSIQILCPQIMGKAGIFKINERIQDALLPGLPGMSNGMYKFKPGDKIMATINEYEQGYFNGDVGIIKEISDVTFTVDMFSKTLIIPREKIKDFQLAYACTIHKSQGSEYDCIIICLPREAENMMKRNLLYTAVTRAKKKVIILAQEKCVSLAISKDVTEKRMSGLTEKIDKLMRPKGG